MNKVVSIEIASQVFWIDEAAYNDLQAYLREIRRQLAGEESSADILKDIELRVAELLYICGSDDKKAITAEQVNTVIKQVGYIDAVDDEPEEEIVEDLPRKSFRDTQNKILGGVCSGLGMRFGVPAFVIRLVFLLLTAAFGLGIALYLIFWISLESNDSRNTALAAEGKARTAKKIAAYDAPKANPFVQLQRIIFLPISLIGTLLSVVGNHFVNRKQGYQFMFRNIFAGMLLLIAFLMLVGIYAFNENRLFPWPIAWVLSASTLYLIVLGLAVYFREFYRQKPVVKVDKKLKRWALAPIGLIAVAITYMTFAQSEHVHEEVERNFALTDNELEVVFIDKETNTDAHSYSVRYQVRTHAEANKQVNLYIDYSSHGMTVEGAKENIQTIDYLFSFNDNKLVVDKEWSLDKGALQRGQYVDVIIEVPQDIIVKSSSRLSVDRHDRPYFYRTSRYKNEPSTYLVKGEHFYEYGETASARLSANERTVLQHKFCEEFFFAETWSCRNNIEYSLADNYRFDKAFEDDIETVDQVREYLMSDRSLFTSNLREMNDLAKALSREYPVTSSFQQHVEQLIAIKAQTPGHDSQQ